jgi:hypothetical protein
MKHLISVLAIFAVIASSCTKEFSAPPNTPAGATADSLLAVSAREHEKHGRSNDMIFLSVKYIKNRITVAKLR